MKLNKIEKEIQSALQSFVPMALKHDLSDRQWTLDIKEIIGNIGKDKNFEICTSSHPGRFLTEWLYDLIWYEADEDGHITELKLIYESEWALSLDAIWYDFEKLLVGKCSQKLMFFQARSNKIEKYFDLMVASISTFKPVIVGERYFLIAYDLDQRQFKYRLRVN